VFYRNTIESICTWPAKCRRKVKKIIRNLSHANHDSDAVSKVASWPKLTDWPIASSPRPSGG
jgi:hypothetical protein